MENKEFTSIMEIMKNDFNWEIELTKDQKEYAIDLIKATVRHYEK